MKHETFDLSGKKSGEIELDETVWGIEPNIAVMHQALVMQLANARVGTHDTKTRAEVRGGGRKPWRQKGTGRARQGSIRAPHWAGGGVVFGPHPRKYTQRMPKRMRRLAVRSALSAKLRDGRVTFVNDLSGLEPKTKAGIAAIGNLPESRSVLILSPEKYENVRRATGNLQDVKTILASYANVRDLLKYDRIVIAVDAVPVLEGILALPEDAREPSVWKQARLSAAEEAAS
ncbi:MAG: 50S ribosomal protein L4 [Thermomicrobiales bacterium]|nr:50S ribosomal protein L4 [Thermomicrobiales bacterium]